MASPAVPLVIGGLFAWSIYRRIRRSIGRQRLRTGRIIVSIVVLALAIVFLLAVAVQQATQSWNMLLALVGGLAVGVPFGFVGLRLTRFETTTEGHFFKPDTRIGIALSLLVIGRVIYRMWALQNIDYSSAHPQMLQSPLTYFIIGLAIGYYLVYRVGLLVHTHDKVIPQKSMVSPPPPLVPPPL
jgi:hypothetical protein